MGGVKFDGGKPSPTLIPWRALREESFVLQFGAEKYGRDNWRKGIAFTRLIDAALRHIHAYNEGEDIDPESALPHIAHARANLAFLIELTQTHPEMDDRHGRQA